VAGAGAVLSSALRMEAIALAAALLLGFLNMAGRMPFDQNLCSTALTSKAHALFLAQSRAVLFVAYRTSKLLHTKR
jgi:hypothetical protein